MATVAHHIYSHYDTKYREDLKKETGQNEDDPWQIELSFGSRRRFAPPYFVPATISHSEWDPTNNIDKPGIALESPATQNDLAGWYRSLTSKGKARDEKDTGRSSSTSPPASESTGSRAQRCSSTPREPLHVKKDTRNKNNWFIMRAIQSEPSTTSITPPPTLADILDRDPPPTSTQKPYVPPVWLALGPSNRGFSMLQRSGWREGQGVGAHIHRPSSAGAGQLGVKINGNGKIGLSAMKQEEEANQDFQEDAEHHEPDVIDLTLSDSDDDEEFGDVFSFVPQTTCHESTLSRPSLEQGPYSQRSLLTPLPTVLKSDRLGIGLKAKMVGQYKESKKRVTHNAAAMAAHIKTAEELRRKKIEVGRGRRGFEKLRKKEEEKRRQLLADLNQ